MESQSPVATHWTLTARLLHWGMALALIVEVLAGFVMALSFVAAATDPAAANVNLRSSQVHNTLGFLLLAAVVFRLWWRLHHPAPVLPGTALAPRIAARTIQGLLYALMLLLPLSGWAALSALGSGAGYDAPSIWFFTYDGFGPGGLIPHIVPPKPWNAPGIWKYGTFAKFHVYAVYFGGVLLFLHVSAALHRHFIVRDGVLRRMLGLS